MSDVEQANTGEIGDKSKATTTTTSNTHTPPLKLKQHNHHHHHHSYAHKTPANAKATTVSIATSASAAAATAAAANTYYCSETHGERRGSFAASTCLSRLLKIVFSTPGLVLLVGMYSVLGALIFPLLEAPQDVTKSAAIAKSREDCLRELWIITEKLNVLYERNWTMLVHEQLRRFEGSIVAATRSGAIGGGGAVLGAGLTHPAGSAGGGAAGVGRGGAPGTSTAVGRFGGGAIDAWDEARWSFSEALLYSVTVITTIGHGSLTPKTAAGKVATILYALIGVPLMLMCLSSLGALLAEALQCTYARLCCRATATTTAAAARHARGGRADKRQRRDSRHEGDAGGDGADADDGDCDVVKQPHGCSSDCRSKSLEVADCKCCCKYDPLMGETMLNNARDYGGKATAITMPQPDEDSCQLLHNSPAKVCRHLQAMAAATATMATNGQYYQRTAAQMSPQQQQQPHHHQQQPRPDVMLMATGQKGPQQAPLSQQQYCNRPSTPSPQHFQHQLAHHPLQAFHIVATPGTATASANSSPTHQAYHHQYATLQPTHRQQQLQQQQKQQQPHLQLQRPTLQHAPQQQQHFVAVPSSMLRFQPLPGGGADGVATLPYQPTSVAVTGAATIYFPLAARSAAPTTTTATTTVASLQQQSLQLCNQPLVKYHTIHLQPKTQPQPSYNGEAQGEAGALALPPPPPAYQTATVHGVRRAKFLTKPLPQEINTLLAESDVLACRQHDLLLGASTTTSAAATPATSPATMAPTSAISAATSTPSTTSTPTSCGALGGGGGSPPLPAAATSTPVCHTSVVDIMEDEDEHEQQRIGNCPHGTPSRVPLISSTGRGGCGSGTATTSDSSTKEPEKSTRSIINATAASFHRHTLQHFQRGSGAGGGARKSATYVTRRGCNMHHSAGGIRAGAAICYGDTATETSDDDEYMQRGSEQFVLEPLETGGEECDNDNDVDDDECDENELDARAAGRDGDGGPHVPLGVVLLILVCYICLGTVIFALWENWSLIDGAYFCFVTLATIGYGDFVPERTFHGPEMQLFACCAYLLLGLVLVAMSFSILETQLMWKCKRIAVRLKLAKD